MVCTANPATQTQPTAGRHPDTKMPGFAASAALTWS